MLIVKPYYPEGVSRILATGGTNYIGFVDDNTVLKYPHDPKNVSQLDCEEKIYTHLGPNPRILEYKGKTEQGILLQFATNGSLAKYLQQDSLVSTTTRQKWALQTAEAVAYIHKQHVLHCDLNATNLLLDNDLNILLCDFQGRILGLDGSVQVDGGVCENAKSRMPGKADNEAGIETDIFALGSTIYYIIQGYEPFPELDTFEDEVVIQTRFALHDFPVLDNLLIGRIVHRCWSGAYTAVEEVVHDLRALSI